MDYSHARVQTSKGFLSPRFNSKPAQKYRELRKDPFHPGYGRRIASDCLNVLNGLNLLNDFIAWGVSACQFNDRLL
jgi:hypothetical protein